MQNQGIFLESETLKNAHERLRKEVLERNRAEFLSEDKLREAHEKTRETREELSTCNAKLRKVR